MSYLLQIVRSRPEVLMKKGAVPLMVEFQVNADSAPYLVSSSGGVMWIDAPLSGDRGPMIRGAVRRDIAPGDLFWQTSKAIFERAQQDKWGSACPYTGQGLTDAIEHVASYDLGPVDILVGPSKETRPKWITDREVGERLRVSSWVPPECLIVVPANRDFLGMLVHLSAKDIVMAVHNPSRGFAMCWSGGDTCG